MLQKKPLKLRNLSFISRKKLFLILKPTYKIIIDSRLTWQKSLNIMKQFNLSSKEDSMRL